MVALYVGGKQIGTVTDAAELIAACQKQDGPVEVHDEQGRTVAVIHPRDPNEPLIPWEPGVTEADIQRRLAGPMFTFDELQKRLGWK